MIELSDLLHYGTITGVVALSSLGAGIAQGITGRAAVKAIDIQPQARNNIARTNLMGMALIDTAVILCLTASLFLLASSPGQVGSVATNIADIGILLALAIPGFAISLACAFPVRESILAIARQPFFSQKISRFMLISLSVIQTPIIFGFIIALLIKGSSTDNLLDSLRFVASGLTVSLACIGPIVGLCLFATSACRALGVNRDSYQKLFTFTFISNAVIETPVVLALVIAFFLIWWPTTAVTDPFMVVVVTFSAALCIGIGTFGSGVSSGRTAAIVCDQIAKNPDLYGVLSKVCLFAQGLIDSCSIYSFIISLAMLLLFLK